MSETDQTEARKPGRPKKSAMGTPKAPKEITETPAPVEPVEVTGAAVETSAQGKMILAKNHGVIDQGKVHRFYEAGHVFDVEADSTVIELLVRTGAQFK